MDKLSKEERSALMRRIRGKDTVPEIIVRKIAHAMGFRFRLHDSTIPGSPDLVFKSRRKAIFVHGCFWHRHGSRCALTRTPKSRRRFWETKFKANQLRDRRNQRNLRGMGWKYLVVWQCQLSDKERLMNKLNRFLGGE
jgi:DNA mismatch endonuclease, patch repair protein